MWYGRNGYPLAAATVLARLGRGAESAELIESRGEEMLAAGQASEIVTLLPVDAEAQREAHDAVHAEQRAGSGQAELA